MSAADQHIKEWAELDRIADEALDPAVKITPEHLAKLLGNPICVEFPKPVVD